MENAWPNVAVSKATGRVPEYEPNRWDTRFEWKPNWEWEAIFRYDGVERGRSAAHFLWRDAADPLLPPDEYRPNGHYAQHPYVMFMQQIGEILEADGVVTREICGVWTWVKRGQNYGIKLVRRLTEGEPEP